MRKILLVTLAIGSASVFALDNQKFQEFDRQMSLGYGAYQMTLQNGAGNQTLQQSQILNLDVERLFDIGVWADITANMNLTTNSLGNQAYGTGQGNSGIPGLSGMPASQDPSLGGVNAKIGYAFPLLCQHLQLTPYALVGRNTNLAMSTIVGNGYANVTNDYFYTGGFGGRIEYRINKTFNLYFDQNMAYNWDQSGPTGGMMPQNTMTFTSTLGAKFNIVKNLQLGANVFYDNYQPMAATPPITASLNGGGSGVNQVSVYQPQYSYGGMISVGLTY